MRGLISVFWISMKRILVGALSAYLPKINVCIEQNDINAWKYENWIRRRCRTFTTAFIIRMTMGPLICGPRSLHEFIRLGCGTPQVPSESAVSGLRIKTLTLSTYSHYWHRAYFIVVKSQRQEGKCSIPAHIYFTLLVKRGPPTTYISWEFVYSQRWLYYPNIGPSWFRISRPTLLVGFSSRMNSWVLAGP